jgi:hypothetical protein
VVLILPVWQLVWLPVLRLVWVDLGAEAQQLLRVVLVVMEAKRIRLCCRLSSKASACSMKR